MSKWTEGSDIEAQQPGNQVPGLAEIYQRFRIQYPELSAQSLRRIFRMADAAGSSSAGKPCSAPAKARGRRSLQPEAM